MMVEDRTEYLREQRRKACKKYRDNNVEKVREIRKKYYDNNKEMLNEKSKRWREENRDRINERNKERIVCDCGREVSRGSLWVHKKSKFHMENSNL